MVRFGCLRVYDSFVFGCRRRNEGDDEIWGTWLDLKRHNYLADCTALLLCFTRRGMKASKSRGCQIKEGRNRDKTISISLGGKIY